jgi:hypothetical protein
MNVPQAGESSKDYYIRQERHWTSQAANQLGADSSTDEELSDKARERRDKKRSTTLKKKAKELAEAAYKEASAA